MGLFSKKSFADLQAEADGGQLRRSLGPWNLTALGIGSIIGTGIFVLTGTAASQNAGPALVLSMIISAAGCAFSGLCYAEFAAMVPVAGSAYTYAYATIGEFLAWIIGWDLILEYALSVVDRRGRLVRLFRQPRARRRHRDPAVAGRPAARRPVQPAGGRHRAGRGGLLVIGIKQSADTNTLLVAIKSVVLIVFVVAGAAYRRSGEPDAVHSAEHRGVRTLRLERRPARRRRDVLRLHRLRRRVDGRAGGARTRRATCRSAFSDRSRSAPSSTSWWRRCCSGSCPISELNVADPLAVGIDATGMTWLSPVIKIAALFGLFSTMLVPLLGADAHFLLDEPGRPAAAGVRGASTRGSARRI